MIEMKKKSGRSISSRINRWYTILMCVLTVGLILSVMTAAGMAQNVQVQQELVRSVERNIDEIEIENGLLDIESDFAFRNGESYVIVYSSDGKVLGGEYPKGASEDIPLENERFDKFDGFYVYDAKIEFSKYDYKINAQTGEVISCEVEAADYFTRFEGELDSYGEGCKIKYSDALDIALKKSGLTLSDIELINIKNYEYNGDYVYEVEFFSNEKAYDDIWIRGIVKANRADGVWGVLVRLVSVLLPLFLLVAVIVGRVITKKALKPVERLCDAVEKTQSGKDLTNRLEISDTDPAISKLTDSFNEMFARLEMSFESERQFSGDVSHELRTPTAVILAECEYQLSSPEIDGECKEGFESIQKQALSMKKLISQLLDITKMEQNEGNLKTEREDFSLLVNAVADDVENLNKRNVTLTRDIDEGVFADMDVFLMSRLVTNLLNNAFTYSKENGSIKLSLKRHNEKTVLTVADDGIGISSEDAEKIWNRFYRVDKARCRENGCSGLGLPMVKQIAHLHNGKITLKSELGKGSTFEVEFPLS